MRKQKRPYQRPAMTVYPIKKMSFIICASEGGGQGGASSIPRSLIYDDEPKMA